MEETHLFKKIPQDGSFFFASHAFCLISPLVDLPAAFSPLVVLRLFLRLVRDDSVHGLDGDLGSRCRASLGLFRNSSVHVS